MNILGVSCYYHDAAAALLQDGRLTAAAEEERFSRVKHDARFPTRAIQFCLRQGSLSVRDLDYVVFYEKPFLKFERLLAASLGGLPRSAELLCRALPGWLTDKLWIRQRLKDELGVSDAQILFSEHHLSHAASAFFCSPFDEAAIVTIDGVGEWATATIGHGRGTQITRTREIRFPHSLGLLYSAFTAWLGFEVNEGEYKVMGMAPYGVPRHIDKVKRVVRAHPDGSFELDLDYFAFHYSLRRAFSGRFVALFGTPRNSESNFFTPATGYPTYFGERPADFDALGAENQYYADVAASLQAVTEEIILNMARHACREAGTRNLCLAGGVALNCSVNGKLLQEPWIDDIYIQPAAGDGGGALGAALYAQHALLGQPRTFVMEHAAWGEEHDEAAIRAFLDGQGIAYAHVEDEAALLDQVVEHLQAGAVVGWFQGRFEWGPRALGQRSILADPRRAEMKDIVNTKIKFREPYRPFAPSVLAERAGEFFEITEPECRYPARFMLYVVRVRPEKQGIIPAVTHVDGTGRLQAVHRDTNPRYYGLIERFGRATGVPVLLNTSFNLRGEPIVNTPAEAYSTFVRSEMDVLVLGQCIVVKRDGGPASVVANRGQEITSETELI